MHIVQKYGNSVLLSSFLMKIIIHLYNYIIFNKDINTPELTHSNNV